MTSARVVRSVRAARARPGDWSRRETPAERRRRAARIVAALQRAYPNAQCSLQHRNPLELLVATVLSAQCTDERVNRVTPALFRQYPDAGAFAAAPLAALEQAVKPTGFYRHKARSIQSLSRQIVERYQGRVPRRMEELLTLQGVARKTANVVLNTAFGTPEGIAVDTHVLRLTALLRLSGQHDRDKVEQDLMALIPQRDWPRLTFLMIDHGRAVCIARRPRCSACVLGQALCPSFEAGRGRVRS